MNLFAWPPLRANAPSGNTEWGSMPTDPGDEPVWHRKASRDMASALLRDAQADHQPVTALWIDIDRFRQFNDTFGHETGDQIIRRLARRILSAAPTGVQFVRVGSDEFVLLQRGLSTVQAEHLARRILTAVERPLAVFGINIHPSVSIGLHRSREGETADELLERADRAMIDAKRQGGNRYVWSGQEAVPSPLGIERSRRELEVAATLHEAIQRGAMWLRYQPILRPDGSLEAVEALMSCALGTPPVSPGEFIPVAEKFGLIDRLGEWSLMEGALCAARLHRMGWPTKVAINVSRAQLLSEGFLDALHGALLCANVPAQWIELELTESLFMESSAVVQNNLRRIRETGVGLAIDDFGTGYSCLANLKDLPATKLKFDRAFIQCLPEDQRAAAIVRSMTDLAHLLGLVVVAEGVETADQLAVCHAATLDATQGYFHAVPMPEHELLTWLQSHYHDR